MWSISVYHCSSLWVWFLPKGFEPKSTTDREALVILKKPSTVIYGSWINIKLCNHYLTSQILSLISTCVNSTTIWSWLWKPLHDIQNTNTNSYSLKLSLECLVKLVLDCRPWQGVLIQLYLIKFSTYLYEVSDFL